MSPRRATSEYDYEFVQKNIQNSREAGDTEARDLHVAGEIGCVGGGSKEGPRGDRGGPRAASDRRKNPRP